MATAPVPEEIRLRRKTRVLELAYGDGQRFELPCEYLRVNSPSAEVQGHGPGQAILLVGKEQVAISEIEPVGHYALRLRFDDGHDSGLYTWEYLHELATGKAERWQEYLDKLAEVGYQRKPAEPQDEDR